MTYIERIFDLSTGETTEIPVSAKIAKQFDEAQLLRAAEIAQELEKANAKAALLEKLGITAEEAALLA
jgi:hypothetical protein